MLSSHYLGPRSLAQDATAAIELLAERLSIEHSVGQTHTVLLVKGCGDEESLEATATYLVAAIAQTIQANLRIRQALFNNSDLHRDLQADIASGCCSFGYFEGLSSERGIAWRVADSLSLRAFLDLDVTEAPPNHSTLSRTRRLGRLSALWGRLTASWDFQWTPAGLVGSIAHRQAA